MLCFPKQNENKLCATSFVYLKSNYEHICHVHKSQYVDNTQFSLMRGACRVALMVPRLAYILLT